MRLRAASAVLALAALCAACGSEQRSSAFDPNRNTGQVRTTAGTLPSPGPDVNLPDDAAKTPVTPDERVWLGQLHRYLIEVTGAAGRLEYLQNDGADNDKIASGKYNRRLRPALATLRSCQARMGKLVGTPPSERVRVGSRYVESMCAHLRQAAGAAQHAIARNDPSPLLVASDELDKGFGQLRLAEQALMPRGEGRELPRIAHASDASRVQTKYSAVAIALEDVAVEIRCWSAADWPKIVKESADYSVEPADPGNEYGFVLTEERANLSPDTCRLLDDLTYRGAHPTGKRELALAQAVVTLAHETQHVAGVGDEAEAECYAMQLARETASRLGASDDYADELASRFWRELYRRRPPDYRSPNCRNGGALDVYPDDALWP
jgi:hypothetical protein